MIIIPQSRENRSHEEKKTRNNIKICARITWFWLKVPTYLWLA